MTIFLMFDKICHIEIPKLGVLYWQVVKCYKLSNMICNGQWAWPLVISDQFQS